MNLYLYFAAPAIQSYVLPGMFQRQGRECIAAFRNSGAPLPLQEEEIRRLVHDLHEVARQENGRNEGQKDGKAVLVRALQKARTLKAQCHGEWRDLSDFFLVVPLWMGVVEGLLEMVLPLHSWVAFMPVGLASLAQGAVVWITLKLLAAAMTHDVSGWKRWVLLGGLFILYLLLMKGASMLPGSIQIPAFGVILACGSIFLTAFLWIRNDFDPDRKIRRIS